MGIIIWNKISSLEVGLRTSGLPAYDIAEYDIESTSVPGRNGDIIIDNDRYKNVHPTYSIAIDSRDKEFTETMASFSAWIHSTHEYARLEDSANPDTYRMGVPQGAIQVENLLRTFGKASLSFNCKPQRYLKSGEIPVILTANGIINNPKPFIALPVITVYGTGSGVLTVGDTSISISDIGGYVTLDSENQECYHVTTPRDGTISGSFPELKYGNNNITISGGITSIEVIPLFWTL